MLHVFGMNVCCKHGKILKIRDQLEYRSLLLDLVLLSIIFYFKMTIVHIKNSHYSCDAHKGGLVHRDETFADLLGNCFCMTFMAVDNQGLPQQ